MARDMLETAVELANSEDEVTSKIQELSMWGSKEDRIVAASLE